MTAQNLAVLALELAGRHSPVCRNDGLWYCRQHPGLDLHPCREYEIAIALLHAFGCDPSDEEIAAIASRSTDDADCRITVTVDPAGASAPGSEQISEPRTLADAVAALRAAIAAGHEYACLELTQVHETPAAES
jgi:hypothetical protein